MTSPSPVGSSVPGNTPISDEAVSAYQDAWLAAVTDPQWAAVEEGAVRAGLAAAAPLLMPAAHTAPPAVVSAEAEREAEPFALLVQENARLREVIAGMDRELEERTTDADRWETEARRRDRVNQQLAESHRAVVEGLRAELAAAHKRIERQNYERRVFLDTRITSQRVALRNLNAERVAALRAAGHSVGHSVGGPEKPSGEELGKLAERFAKLTKGQPDAGSLWRDLVNLLHPAAPVGGQHVSAGSAVEAEPSDAHEHRWIDLANEFIESGEMCIDCRAVRAAAAADVPGEQAQ